MLKVFLSYPHVERKFSTMLRDTLEAHDVWYDQRLCAGQNWWQEIINQIEQCHVFLHVLSEASLKSYYCNKELELARELHKIIIHIKSEEIDSIPDSISAIQQVDMVNGVDVPGTRELLNALIVAERSIRSTFDHTFSNRRAFSSVGHSSSALTHTTATKSADITLFPGFNAQTFIPDVVKALESHDFDHAIVLMEEAKNRRLVFAGFDVDDLLKYAKSRFEQQVYRVGRESEYKGIASMVKSSDARLRERGMNMFQKYRQVYPEYDPIGLRTLCMPLVLPDISWCMVHSGEVTLRYPDRKAAITYDVPLFNMSKHPITNAQYQVFLDAPDGFCDKRWWGFSPAGSIWREKHPTPLPARSPYGDHPRVNISWFDAMAFCHWLSYKTGWRITLPTEQQWQRGAQGNDSRQYPWGPRFYRSRCNGQEARITTTSAVGRFRDGSSPFQLMDMAGNVWEYCRTQRRTSDNKPVNEVVAKGGSYLSSYKDVRVTSRTYVKPGASFGTVGFRIVRLGDA